MKKLLMIPVTLLCLMSLAACGEGARIKEEIFAYVLENKDSIELDAPYGYQFFLHAVTGNVTASVDYGYYYSKDNNYLEHHGSNFVDYQDNKYKNGYRYFEASNDPTDWYYTEKICDNWYYYELHDG